MSDLFSKIVNAEIQDISWEDAVTHYENYSLQSYSALLLGSENNWEEPYSFIGFNPYSILRYTKEGVEFKTESGTQILQENPWKSLTQLMETVNFDEQVFPANLCGSIGYFSYDIKDSLEKLPKTTIDEFDRPLFEFVLYNDYVIFDNINKFAWRVHFHYSEKSNISSVNEADKNFRTTKLSSDISKADYLEKVAKIIDYIRAGDVYEVNFTRRLKTEFSGNSFTLFKKLYSINAAPFSAFLNFGKLKILSNSPELFLKGDSAHIQTRPIKGTISRGKDVESDRKQKEKLMLSEKDQAELYMIIDLMRNDLSKVCSLNTVKVKNAKGLEKFENVWHLVGIVEGELAKDLDYIDLFKATLPGGSISGCPKVRAMEIIDELELFSRQLYTGSIVLMNKKRMVSNIIIRTIFIEGKILTFNSGGAITIDSKPESEYGETEDKIQSIIKSLETE